MNSQTTDKDQFREETRIFLQEMLVRLVSHPESLQVKMVVGDNTTIYHVETEQSNFPQILGSKGRNINSMRTIIAAICARHGVRAVIELPYFQK
jgi:predicted RNA-binding protein YlqC (UPF0109 family)